MLPGYVGGEGGSVLCGLALDTLEQLPVLDEGWPPVLQQCIDVELTTVPFPVIFLVGVQEPGHVQHPPWMGSIF